jgi:release factor glutamine methyltransferase
MTSWQVTGDQLWPWYRAARQESTALGIESQEIDWFLQTVSNLDRLALRLEEFAGEMILLDRPWPEIMELWQRRCRDRQPIQYLVGSTAWREFELRVSPAVLIPRPETELIIDLVLDRLSPEQAGGHWVDLGTGSGAIACGLAASLPQAQIHAVDCSADALDIARSNGQNLGLSDRITFYQGSWWQPLAHLRGQVSGMVSNPPYIPSQTVKELQPEVVNWEPHLALDGGADGLKAIRELVKTAPQFLQAGGCWIVEMMAGQGQAVVELLADQGCYESIEIINDWTGRDRFVFAKTLVDVR